MPITMSRARRSRDTPSEISGGMPNNAPIPAYPAAAASRLPPHASSERILLREWESISPTSTATAFWISTSATLPKTMAFRRAISSG